jgi:ADP-ribosylglycohydrolase
VELIQRYRGSLLGLAAGDALGTTVEFKKPGSFTPVKTITGGGPFNLKPGEWTDDTSMALCLAESLIVQGGFDPADQMLRYCRWKNGGHLSSNGRCFDIGGTVGEALRRFEDTGEAYSGSTDPRAAGNGSLMRLAPVPLFFANDPRSAIKYAADSSRTTHGAREAIDACRYMAALVVGALRGKSKDELLEGVFEPAPGFWNKEPLAPAVEAIAAGSFKRNDPPLLSGMGGYVIPSLEIALWAFHHADDFRDGALRAVNLGYDADTYGAIYGQLAGAYYGDTGIPGEWRESLAKRDLITSYAGRLYNVSMTSSSM